MIAWVISLDDAGASATQESSRAVGNAFKVGRFRASTPATVHDEMQAERLTWTYPWDGVEVRDSLRLHPYRTRNRDARMACSMSHIRLWQACAAGEERFLVLEDDALFTQRLPTDFDMGGFGMVSINDPHGATRRAREYHAALRADAAVVEVPWVDEQDVPQGLPGHSAYLLQPQIAEMLVDLARKNGAWPNDCLAHRRALPGLLGCSTVYYTRVAGRRSTLA